MADPTTPAPDPDVMTDEEVEAAAQRAFLNLASNLGDPMDLRANHDVQDLAASHRQLAHRLNRSRLNEERVRTDLEACQAAIAELLDARGALQSLDTTTDAGMHHLPIAQQRVMAALTVLRNLRPRPPAQTRTVTATISGPRDEVEAAARIIDEELGRQ